MKLSVFFLLIALTQVSAKGYSQISLDEQHSSLEKVLLKIKKQVAYNFIYDEEKLKITDINVKVTSVSLKVALDACFKGQLVVYSIIGNNVVLKPAKSSGQITTDYNAIDTVLVQGDVTDSTGKPLNGATISIIETKYPSAQATPVKEDANTVAIGSKDSYSISNENGHFHILAYEGDLIAVSFIGYQTTTFRVRKRMGIQHISLSTVSSQLREVIVNTGYQKLSKERATGSFSKPDMKIFANRSSTMDLAGRLDGLVAGLFVAPASSFINGSGTNVNTTTNHQTQNVVIRGVSTVAQGQSTQPLYVINGVISNDLGGLNLDDIADITVLKDAAAAAIWGAQATNGVIVITTKAGSQNQKIKIAYSGFVNREGKPDFDYVRKQYLSSQDYIKVAKQLFDPVNYPYSTINSPYNYYGAISPSQQILYNQSEGLITAAQANAQLDSLARLNNTQQVEDLAYRNAFTTNHTISASGGTNTYSIYGSLGYTNSHSYNLGDDQSSYKINLSQSFTPNDRFSFSLNAQLANNISTTKNPPLIAGDVLPYQLFRDANGNNINMPFLSGWTPDIIKQYSDESGINMGRYQLFDELNYRETKNNSYTVNLVGNATIRLWKGLQYLGTYGYYTAPTRTDGFQSNESYSYRRMLLNFTMAGPPPTYLLPKDGETYTARSADERDWTVRNQLAYTYSGRNDDDHLSVQIGQEAHEMFNNFSSSTVYGYNRQLQTYSLLDYAVLSQGVSGTIGGFGYGVQQPFDVGEGRSRFNSYFALGSYTLNKKYSLDVSWRVDHSNLFGTDQSAQNKPAYSFGGKWNLKNEHFLNDVTWLNAMALRATYGITGNSPYVGAASTKNIYYASDAPGGGQYPSIGGPSYQISNPATNKLTWESTKTTNLGMDFSVLKNRITGTIEYYQKNTSALLNSFPLSYFTGFTASKTNIGKLVNKGMTINLNSINVATRNFTWQTGFVLSFNRNKLVDYLVSASVLSSPYYKLSGSVAIPGDALNSLYAYKYAGLDNKGYPQIYLADGKKTTDPYIATSDDLVNMGSSIPKFNGGITNTFRYRQFQLFVNMTYSLGGVMRRDVNQFYAGMLSTNSTLSGNISTDFLNRWQNPGDENKTSIPGYLSLEDYSGRNTQYYTSADINVVSSSYLKLNEAGLIYDLNSPALRWLKIQGVSLKLQVNNILLWKANKFGLNPEFQSPLFSNRNIPVNQHSITLGANVNF